MDSEIPWNGCFFLEVLRRRVPPSTRITATGEFTAWVIRQAGASLECVVAMDRSFLQEDSETEEGFTFGNLRLEPDGTLLRGDETIHLAPKELAALRVLLAHPARIVTPAQLKEFLWPDVHVTADSVPRCISSLRSRLGPQVLIRTIYKRGYRLESPVQRHVASEQKVLPRLAILPFAGGMFVPEYLGPAFAEDAAAHLRGFHPSIVHVLPRDSVCTLAVKGLTAQEIGRKMSADLVLAGTVQTSTLFLRVRAEMLTVPEGNQIWVEEALGPRERSAALEQRLLERLAYRLGGLLPVSISASIDETGMEEPDISAYEAFLVGRYESRSRDPHRMRNAVELLLKAADLDGTSLAAREHLVKVSINQSLFGYASPAIAAEQVRRAADAIPETDRTSAIILPALGWILFHIEHNMGFAVRMLNGALPAHVGTLSTTLRAMLALSRLRFDEAYELLEEALRDDLWSPSLHAQLAWTHHLAGNAQESLDQAEQCLTMFPGDEHAELCAALILAFNDDPNRAAGLAHGVTHRRPYLDIAAAIEAYALARAARGVEASEILERLQWLGRERYVLRSFTAAAYLELGEVDAAIAELQAAEVAHCPWFFQVLADPRLRSLDGNPEFERMRGRLEGMEATVAAESECLA